MLIDWCHVGFCYYSRSKKFWSLYIQLFFASAFYFFIRVSFFCFASNLIFFFIVAVFFLVLFFQDKIPLPNKSPKKFTFLSFKSYCVVHERNSCFEYTQQKKYSDRCSKFIGLFMTKIELIEHIVIQLCMAYIPHRPLSQTQTYMHTRPRSHTHSQNFVISWHKSMILFILWFSHSESHICCIFNSA